MKLLDTYAINCGAKIHKPFVYESYFPLPIEKFVTFQAQSKFPSKDYDYWQDVIDLLIPAFSKQGIHILQVGKQEEFLYQRVIDVRGKTNVNQLAYIIHRSMLHFGPDSLGIHLASSFDIPLVGLYSIIQPEIAGPHFGSPEKQILFKGYERVGNHKPSYAAQETPKSINKINPEEVANAILKLLNIDEISPFSTVFIGEKYGNKIIREVIPNNSNVAVPGNVPIEIRADLFFDQNMLAQYLNTFNQNIIVTDKRIDIGLLKHFKPRIPLFVYRVTENDEPQYVKEVIQAGLPVLIVSKLTPEELEKKKINYYEYGKIHPLPKPDPKVLASLQQDINKLYFKTSKIIYADGKAFSNHAAREQDTPLRNDFEYNRVIDSPKFWDDLDFYHIVKIND